MTIDRFYAKRIKCCYDCPHLAFVEYENNSYCYANGECANIDNKIIKNGKIPSECPLPKMTAARLQYCK